ncbi:tape measure protein [Ewingella sp. CoE-038-23]|uniref:tape measure protein n=1 Tax=Ewingella docleensis TaxID=3118588 RepID=UPI0033656B26
MSTVDGGKLQYEIDIETAKLITGSRKASVVIEQMRKDAEAAGSGLDNMGRKGNKAAGEMGYLKSALSGVASAITVALVVDYAKAFLTVADNITQLQSRISRLTADVSQASATFQALSQIASVSGASLQDTQKLWEKLTSSLKGTGTTNDQILFLTDTLQKIGRVGGSSAEEMANALRQFGQSIDGGVVRAQEFNSVVESMPELARQMAAGLGMSMGQLRQAMLEGKITAEAALNAIAKQSGVVNEEFGKLPRTMDQASNSLTISLQNLIGKMNDAMGASTAMVKIIDSVSSAIDRLSGKTDTASQKIADLTSTAEMYQRRARTWAWIGLDGWSAQDKAIAGLSNRAATLVGDLDSVSKAGVKVGKIDLGAQKNPKEDVLVKRSQRRIELSKLEGEERARLQAQYDAEDAGIAKDDPIVKRLQDQYAETERNTAARKANNSEGKKSASQAQAIAEKLADLKQQSELTGDSTRELSRQQAILTAQQSLGSAATEEDIKLAGEYAAAKWDTGNAIRAQAAAEKLIAEKGESSRYEQETKDLNTALSAKKITQDQYNKAAEKSEREHQTNLAKIRSDSVVSPQQEAAGLVDPVQQLANENAKKLALIQQFEANKTITEQQAIALRSDANTQYEKQRMEAQWEIFRNQSQANEMLASSLDALQGGASSAITGLLNGTQSLQESFANIGTTILNSVVSSFVQMGIEWVKAQVMGQAAATAALAATIGQATAAASAWAPAAISASIATFGSAAAVGQTAYAGSLLAAKGMAIAGARYNGGPVSANSMYRVGEKGKPEIYQASNGSQYMIPGDNGRVISNKDMQGGGSGAPSLSQVMNLTINTTGGVDDATIKQLRNAWRSDTLALIKDQSTRPNGMIAPRK